MVLSETDLDLVPSSLHGCYLGKIGMFRQNHTINHDAMADLVNLGIGWKRIRKDIGKDVTSRGFLKAYYVT